MPKTRMAYGLWDSPITPARMGHSLRLIDALWDQSGSLVWLEGRADRRALVVQTPGGESRRDLNSEFSAKGKLGYGGGDFGVGGGQVFFVDGKSGRIYRQPLEAGLPHPVTPAFGGSAAPALSPDGQWLLFANSYEDQDCLAIVDAGGKFWPQKLVSGEDFYMQPTWHPDGRRVAWITWNHPNMPWDGTLLRLGYLDFRQDSLPVLKAYSTLAGDADTSIFQPEFSPDGRTLAYVSDVNGWWHIYLYDLESGETHQLTQGEAEHGMPGWIQGMRTYGFAPDGRSLYFIRMQMGRAGLWRAELPSGRLEQVSLPDEYTWLTQIAVSPKDGQVALLATGGRTPTRLIVYQPSSGETRLVCRLDAGDLPETAFSTPQAISWQGMDGGEAHGILYLPHSESFEGAGKPPLIVDVHGGPTSQRNLAFDLDVQFFTSRGYAVLQPNHRGSTGYGRTYRNMLRGNWGIYDVQDSVSGARHLAEQGLVDGDKLIILGGSAGGFTVLMALEQYPGFFKAGVNLYGVSSQFDFTSGSTHKFEVRYNDTLLGPYPEAAEIYRQRSPIFFVDQIQDPIAVFQGEDDIVVPRRHSDQVVQSLQQRGVPHIYHLYPGEGHGFGKPETLEHYFTEVEKFLRQYVVMR